MPSSINRGVHLEGIQGEQHQLWSLSVNTTHLFVYLLSFLLSLRSIRDIILLSRNGIADLHILPRAIFVYEISLYVVEIF